MTTSWKPWEGKKTSIFTDVRKFLPKNIYGKYTDKDGLELTKERIRELQKDLDADNEAKNAALRARNRQAIRSIPGNLKKGIAYLGSDELGDKIPEWVKGGKSWMQPTINPRDVGMLPKQIPITVDGKKGNYTIPDRPGSEFTSGGEGLKFKSLAAQERFLEEDEKAIAASQAEMNAANKAEIERYNIEQEKIENELKDPVSTGSVDVNSTEELKEKSEGTDAPGAEDNKWLAHVNQGKELNPDLNYLARTQDQNQAPKEGGGEPKPTDTTDQPDPNKAQQNIDKIAGAIHGLATIAKALDTGEYTPPRTPTSWDSSGVGKESWRQTEDPDKDKNRYGIPRYI